MDGHAYPTWRFWMNYYRTRVFDPRRWLSRLKRLAARPQQGVAPAQEGDFVPEMPPRHAFEADVERLVERGTRLLYVFTSRGPCEVNYERQIHDCVPRVDLDRHATVRYFPRTDHTFTIEEDRRELIEVIADWMDSVFPAEAGAASEPSGNAAPPGVR